METTVFKKIILFSLINCNKTQSFYPKFLQKIHLTLLITYSLDFVVRLTAECYTYGVKKHETHNLSCRLYRDDWDANWW